jgi:hypothetical protein
MSGSSVRSGLTAEWVPVTFDPLGYTTDDEIPRQNRSAESATQRRRRPTAGRDHRRRHRRLGLARLYQSLVDTAGGSDDPVQRLFGISGTSRTSPELRSYRPEPTGCEILDGLPSLRRPSRRPAIGSPSGMKMELRGAFSSPHQARHVRSGRCARHQGDLPE